MRPRLLALAAALAVPLAAHAQPSTSPPSAAVAPDDALTAARVAVDAYLAGHATGDGAHFRRAFHPVATLYWMREGALQQRTSEAYIAGASGQPAADEALRRRRIVMLDVTGDAGVAKVELDYPTAVLVDYLSLLRVDGEWKIVGKIFTVGPPSGR